MQCFTKLGCPGYVIYDAECRSDSNCPIFLHDDDTGKEYIEESECSAMGPVTFVTDQNEKLCIPLDQCLLKGGYFLTTEKQKICVNVTACSS